MCVVPIVFFVSFFLKKRREVWGYFFFPACASKMDVRCLCLQYGEIKQSHLRSIDRGYRPATLRNGAGLPPLVEEPRASADGRTVNLVGCDSVSPAAVFHFVPL